MILKNKSYLEMIRDRIFYFSFRLQFLFHWEQTEHLGINLVADLS